jgi:hypothetical protein
VETFWFSVLPRPFIFRRTCQVQCGGLLFKPTRAAAGWWVMAAARGTVGRL